MPSCPQAQPATRASRSASRENPGQEGLTATPPAEAPATRPASPEGVRRYPPWTRQARPLRTCHQPQTSTSRRLEIRQQAAHDVIALPGAEGLTRLAPVLPDGRFVTDGDISAVVRGSVNLTV